MSTCKIVIPKDDEKEGEFVFQGPEMLGDRMELFHAVAGIARDIHWFDGRNSLSGVGHSVADLAGHKHGKTLAIETLKGFTLDGEEITSKNWSSLFSGKGRYMLPYIATIRVWKEAGFLDI